MKARKQVVDAVEEYLNEDAKGIVSKLGINSFHLVYMMEECYLVGSTNQREIRAAIQELRNTGRVRLLIASGKGYKFATTTAEVRTYIKRLHKKAMNDLRLIQNIKSQAEADLGMQVNMEFWNEIYKQTK